MHTREEAIPDGDRLITSYKFSYKIISNVNHVDKRDPYTLPATEFNILYFIT